MMTGNSKPEHRVSVHLRQRLACDFSVGKYGSIHFRKKNSDRDVMREYELYDYIQTLLMFYVSHIARWLPCID